jgi:hypothetical protein
MKPIYCLHIAVIVVGGLTLASEAKPVPKALASRPTIHCDFRNKHFDQDAFDVWGENTDKHIRREKEGLRISLPLIFGPARDPVGIILRHKVCGDFEFNAAFEVLEGKGQWPAELRPSLAAGINVHFEIESPPRPHFFVGKFLDPNRGAFLHAGVSVELNDEKRARALDHELKTKQAEGEVRIRLVRRGTMLEFSAREKESTNFTILGSFDVSADDIQFLRLAAKAGHVPVDIRILNCSIQARELLPK